MTERGNVTRHQLLFDYIYRIEMRFEDCRLQGWVSISVSISIRLRLSIRVSIRVSIRARVGPPMKLSRRPTSHLRHGYPTNSVWVRVGAIISFRSWVRLTLISASKAAAAEAALLTTVVNSLWCPNTVSSQDIQG